MRKWFLGDDKAFAAGLDEMEDSQSEPPLSRQISRSESPSGMHGTDHQSSSSSTTSMPPPRFSSVEPPASSSRSSSTSETRQPLAYQQRKLDRAAHRTRSSASSPLSGITGHDYRTDSPPAFASTDPHPHSRAASTIDDVPDDTETMDSEVARDLKEMYINRYQ